jgi:hypothetical protein
VGASAGSWPKRGALLPGWRRATRNGGPLAVRPDPCTEIPDEDRGAAASAWGLFPQFPRFCRSWSYVPSWAPSATQVVSPSSHQPHRRTVTLRSAPPLTVWAVSGLADLETASSEIPPMPPSSKGFRRPVRWSPATAPTVACYPSRCGPKVPGTNTALGRTVITGRSLEIGPGGVQATHPYGVDRRSGSGSAPRCS